MDKFPECVLESGGDLVVDCIEQMCGKKIQFVKLSENHSDSSSGKGHPPPSAGGTTHVQSNKRFLHLVSLNKFSLNV